MEEDADTKSKMEAPNRVCDENNIVRLKDPPANYRSHICKYVGFKILHINVMETTDKGKICVNDVHDLQNLQYQQPIFDQNMRLAIVLEVPVDSQKQLWLK